MNWLRLLVRGWLGIPADQLAHQADHQKWHEQAQREYQQMLNEQAARYSEQQRMAVTATLEGLQSWGESGLMHEFWRAAIGAGKPPDEAYAVACRCMEIERERLKS